MNESSMKRAIIALSVIGISIVAIMFSITVFAEEKTYMESYIGGDAEMVGSAMCIACHRSQAPGENERTHATVFDSDEECAYYGNGCEACHGPGSKHNGNVAGILSFGKMPQNEITNRCTMCHSQKGVFKLTDWKDSEHADEGISCTACHSGHSANENFLINSTVKDLCAMCHGDIVAAFDRGEHGAPGSSMTCTNCHNPHKN